MRQSLIAAAGIAAVLAAPAAADAAPAKPGKPALSVRLATTSQAKALKSGKLRVRVVARRATRVRLGAKLGKKQVARRKTVSVKPRARRVVSLRLSRSGKRLLAGCGAHRITIAARDLRAGRTQVSRSPLLRLDTKRCAGKLPGCAKPNAPGGEWPFYSGTLDGHREQLGEKKIGTASVEKLGVAWQTPMPDGGVIHSTPVVVGGCVYTGTEFGNVFALNADTGKVVWKRAVGKSEGSGTFAGAGIVGSPAVADGLVFVPATMPKASVLSALDQATGRIVWKRVVDKDPGGGLDSSPVPFKGMVFQAFKGDESSDHSNPGFVILDGSRKGRGKILVKTRHIPEKDYKAGFRGGSMINTPAVDLKRLLVFGGTGNPASAEQHPRTNSLLKIDGNPESKTFGQILASHRGTSDSYPAPQDVDSPTCQSDVQWPIGRFSCAQFDFNFLASPNLWSGSDGRQMFGGLQKSGVYTAVYTDSMERAWQATLGPPCFGCNLSSSAVDKNGIYVAVSGGNLYSLNRDTGAVQWATPQTGTFRYNGLAVANGIVYSLNDATGTLQAFDTGSGAELFAHPFTDESGRAMNDMGNSSGVSVARNTVFATSQADGTSTLFALKLGAKGGGGDGGGGDGGGGEDPPSGGESPLSGAVIATGPGASSYGYITPLVFTSKGGAVSYTNADAVKHNVASPDGLFSSELADSGQTVPVTGVEKLEPGTYEFICQPHPNMKGQLVVQ